MQIRRDRKLRFSYDHTKIIPSWKGICGVGRSGQTLVSEKENFKCNVKEHKKDIIIKEITEENLGISQTIRKSSHRKEHHVLRRMNKKRLMTRKQPHKIFKH